MAILLILKTKNKHTSLSVSDHRYLYLLTEKYNYNKNIKDIADKSEWNIKTMAVHQGQSIKICGERN